MRHGAQTWFAQILGVVLILVGLVGLVLGDRVWLGILNVDIVEDIVHLATGGLLAYVGFGRMDLSTARSVVLALGIIYLVVGILGFVVPMMFGLIPTATPSSMTSCTWSWEYSASLWPSPRRE